ncbi:MAG: Hsp20/alpha crystallin family protein [Actinobacteria bacterium]|nr:Hsp20/alpha crystallin family protein [Actinomycetota bacterium]
MLMRTDPMTELFGLPRATEPSLAALNAYRHGDVITVEFDLPGVDASTIDLQIERGELRLQAKRTTDAPDGARFLVRERSDATVTRRLMLGDVLDVEHVDATYRDGVLTLRIPLHETAKPRRITVKSDESLEAGAKVPIESTAT